LESARDAKIVEACLAGDGRAYAGLVRRHGKRVYAICLAMTGSAEDAEDMAQEALMRGFTELGSLRDRDRFGPWIGAIAGNVCRNFRKKRARRDSDVSIAADCPAADADDLSDLREALGRVPEQHRLPLMLYYFDGRSAENLAAVLGISCEAVYTRLSRARRELRKLLESEGGAR
jgi:RNA polymerase sigma-70 factor (ECF subfamily)